MATGASFHRRRYRTEQLHLGQSEIDRQALGDVIGRLKEILHLILAMGVGTQQRQIGEGRQAGGAALLQGLAGKGRIAFLGQLHHERMIGQMGLDQHLARFLGAPGTAGHLDDLLGHALAGAEVGGKQPAVGVQHGDQGHLGKVVALGEHLGADQDAGRAAVDGSQQLAQGVLARRGVAVDAQHRDVREQQLQAFLGAFGAGTHRTQVELAAGGAVARGRLALIAMVAAQLAGAAVIGHAGVAARALGQPAAIVAEQGGGEAAAIEEHQHLLAAFQGRAHGLEQRLGQAAVQGATAHVQALEARRLGATGAERQTQMGVTALLGVVQAFQRGRGRTQHHRQILEARADHRQVAGVVPQAFLLFIGGVVFFVDDDQPGVLERGEQRRAGAHHDVQFAIAGGQPDVHALAIGQRRMQQGDARIEALFEATQGLGPQVDLGDQQQGLASRFQGGADQLQIDLGLAAAGHPFQQITVEAAAGADRFVGQALLAVERQLGLGKPGALVPMRLVIAGLHLDQALGLQEIEAVLDQAELAEQFVQHAMGVLAQGLERLALARRPGQARIFRAGVGLGDPEALQPSLRRFSLTQKGRKCPAQGVAEAVLIVLGGPLAEFEQRARQWRTLVEQLQRLAQLVRRHLGLLGDLDQDPDHLAAAKGHPQPHARAQLLLDRSLGRQIVEQAAQRGGQRQAQDQGHGRARRRKARW